jgi:hypothetical protein
MKKGANFGMRMDAHTEMMLNKLQRKFEIEKSDVVRQALEVVYLQEFKEERDR